MGLLSSAGKDAGIEAARELHATVDDALGKVANSVVPALGDTVKGAEDHAVYGLDGLLTKLRNTLNGASIPMHWELRVGGQVVATIDGTIGPLKLTVVDEMPSQTVEVVG